MFKIENKIFFMLQFECFLKQERDALQNTPGSNRTRQ